jgi:GT2 family glycosyltransferase
VPHPLGYDRLAWMIASEESRPGQPRTVSILIVNYRAYEELDACLRSASRYAAGDVEVIVVDHAAERDAAASLARAFPWVRWIQVDRNPGFAAGVNRGARAASGTYLLLLNPDCVLEGDIAHELSAWLERHPDVAVAGAVVHEPDGSVQQSARRFPDITTGFAGRTAWLSRVWPANPWTRRNLVAPARDGPVEVDWVSGACLMVRRDAFESVGGMDEKFFLYWEDADLCFRLKREGWLTMYVPLARVTHLTGRSSAKAQRQSLIAFHRSAYRYYCKHGGPIARLAAPLVYVTLQARLLMKLARLGLRKDPRE